MLTVRLVAGSVAHEGLVEVFYSGQWGTVDDSHWTDLNARVVCRSVNIELSLVNLTQCDVTTSPRVNHMGYVGSYSIILILLISLFVDLLWKNTKQYIGY